MKNAKKKWCRYQTSILDGLTLFTYLFFLKLRFWNVRRSCKTATDDADFYGARLSNIHVYIYIYIYLLHS